MIFAVALLFANGFFDSSTDGQTYHQASIIILGQCWNPIYDNTETGIATQKTNFTEYHDDGFYDMHGRKVKTPRKGIYIRNRRSLVY